MLTYTTPVSSPTSASLTLWGEPSLPIGDSRISVLDTTLAVTLTAFDCGVNSPTFFYWCLFVFEKTFNSQSVQRPRFLVLKESHMVSALNFFAFRFFYCFFLGIFNCDFWAGVSCDFPLWGFVFWVVFLVWGFRGLAGCDFAGQLRFFRGFPASPGGRHKVSGVVWVCWQRRTISVKSEKFYIIVDYKLT